MIPEFMRVIAQALHGAGLVAGGFALNGATGERMALIEPVSGDAPRPQGLQRLTVNLDWRFPIGTPQSLPLVTPPVSRLDGTNLIFEPGVRNVSSAFTVDLRLHDDRPMEARTPPHIQDVFYKASTRVLQRLGGPLETRFWPVTLPGREPRTAQSVYDSQTYQNGDSTVIRTVYKYAIEFPLLVPLDDAEPVFTATSIELFSGPLEGNPQPWFFELPRIAPNGVRKDVL